MPDQAFERRRTAWRIFLTVWLAYSLHFSTNVVRETYLAITLGERFSVRVDEYLGLHPDLFEIPGRGAYINNNPGASMLGAIPYAMARPAIDLLFRWKPSLIAPKAAAQYEDPRPNRSKFMNRARARGLDVKLGIAALVTQVGFAAPTGALAAVLLFYFLAARLREERTATWLALAFAFATPNFFRAAFLNQNAIIAHLVLCAYVLMVGLTPRDETEPIPTRALVWIGVLLGFSMVCDYSGVPLAIVFGLWIMREGWRHGGAPRSIRDAATYTAGALGPLALLLAYQWAAFGDPLWPAQRYMPPTEYSVHGFLGFTVPTWTLLWGNLFEPRYGLFTFAPVLLLAFAAPWLRERRGGPSASQLGWIFAAFGALYLFSSANGFANLQWNTGVRYMVPAAPLLFIAAVPVLLRAPGWLRWGAIGVSVAIELVTSMTREDVPTALAMVLRSGPTLPTAIVFDKMRSGYPALASLVPFLPALAYGGLGVLVWLLWRRWPARATSATR